MEKHSLPPKGAIIVFAKTVCAPVKTRITRTEGRAAANQIYRELLFATAESLKELPYHLAFAGNQDPGELATIFAGAVSFFPQTGVDLGERMKNACLHCKESGYSHFIVIGCDCPERTAEEILLAANYLVDGTDVVLGPVEDGGYHLAGVNERGLQIFNATLWSTPELMKETLAIATKYSLKTRLLSTRKDIDTIDDYAFWKGRGLKLWQEY